ncbi:hypothetical protein JNL27_14205, partial [bacterium]|nr:hypothetical protein [bacterium]
MRRHFIFLLVFVTTPLFAQTSDYLIVENPFELRILNKFEQTLGQTESTKLYPFMPLEIINSRILMSDHLTTGIKVRSGTDIYILLSDANGQPVNIASAGSWKIYYGVKAFSDTITILQENAMGLYSGIIPSSSVNRSLRSTEKLLRIFLWDKWTYVYSMTDHKAGWVALRLEGESWTKLSAPKTKLFVLSDLEISIQGVVDNANV